MDILRKIVAGPRARHEEANLDLCYVTPNIVATSGPSSTYPQIAYRNPLSQLVKFLDSKHADNWAIWEFRAEGTGYPDEEVYGRIRHYPWPDHHPPPFALVPLMMASMRDWRKGNKDRVCVVHCKAGKGRSGTVSCSYLISEEGWTAADAMQRFTERRMKPGFGNGISIPSQVRWIGYVDRWTKGGKVYVERQVEVMEVHVWGLRDGVKIAIEGYVDEGKVIKNFHTFTKSERDVVKGEINKDSGFANVAFELMGRKEKEKESKNEDLDAGQQIKTAEKVDSDTFASSSGDVIFRPSTRVVLPSSDINIDFERRNNSKYGGFTMVTSVAHVWFNTYFEGRGPEQGGKPEDSGVFAIDFDAMDGIKGSSRKGTRAFDKMSVVWKAVASEDGSENPGVVITEPKEGEEVPQARPADWKKGSDGKSEDFEKKLGMREATTESAEISRANSLRTDGTDDGEMPKDEFEGVRQFDEGQSEAAQVEGTTDRSSAMKVENARPTTTAPAISNENSATEDFAHPATANLPGGRPEEDMPSHHDHIPGSVKLGKNFTSSS